MAARALRSVSDHPAATAVPGPADTSHPPYLFADSVPFAHEFDCISSLSGVVDLAAVVLAQSRIEKELRAQLAAASVNLAQQLTRVTGLEAEVARVAPRVLLSGREGDLHLQEFADDVGKAVLTLAGTVRQRLEQELASKRKETEAAIFACESTARAAVSRFVLGYELPLAAQRFEAALGPSGYGLRLTQQLAGGIEVVLRVQEQGTELSEPKRLSQLVGTLRLPVGHKRALLSQSQVPDLRSVGDYLVTRLTLEGDVLDVELRKRRDAPEQLQLQLVRYNDGVIGQVWVDGSEHAFDIPLEHAAKLGPVFHALRTVCTMPRKAFAEVTGLCIDGQPALIEGGPGCFLDRLVELFEPIVSQLRAHGAATGELSLKRDLGDGRREERFVSLEHLVDKVSALSREDRARLSGLGLDRDYRRSQSGSIHLPVSAKK